MNETSTSKKQLYRVTLSLYGSVSLQTAFRMLGAALLKSKTVRYEVQWLADGPVTPMRMSVRVLHAKGEDDVVTPIPEEDMVELDQKLDGDKPLPTKGPLFHAWNAVMWGFIAYSLITILFYHSPVWWPILAKLWS